MLWVLDVASGAEWQLSKDYDDFLSLHQELQTLRQSLGKLDFPPKRASIYDTYASGQVWSSILTPPQPDQIHSNQPHGACTQPTLFTAAPDRIAVADWSGTFVASHRSSSAHHSTSRPVELPSGYSCSWMYPTA